MKKENSEDKEIQLSLSTKEVIVGKNNDTFCSTMLRLINDMKVPSDKYFISNNWLLHKVVREDNKLFHTLVVSINFSKYIIHYTQDALGHKGTARTYQCLKQLFHQKRLNKDVHVHVRQRIKCREQKLYPKHYAQLQIEVASMTMNFIVINLIGRLKLSPQR